MAKTKKVKEYPKLETEDMFGNKVVAGNMVMFARSRGLYVGIFIRRNKKTSSVAIKEDFWGTLPSGGYGVTRSFTLIQAAELFLIEDPIHRLNSKVIQDALVIVPDLKTGEHLSKNFDENIAWGASPEEESE
jgi:hypothetical protein